MQTLVAHVEQLLLENSTTTAAHEYILESPNPMSRKPRSFG